MDKVKYDLYKESIYLKGKLDTSHTFCNTGTINSFTADESVKLHYVDNERMMGSLPTLHDMFIGFKNNSDFSITITAKIGDTIISNIIIPKKSIGYLFDGYPLPSQFFNTNIEYEIKEHKPRDYFVGALFGMRKILVQFVYAECSQSLKSSFENVPFYIIHNNGNSVLLFYMHTLHHKFHLAYNDYCNKFNPDFAQYREITNKESIEQFKIMHSNTWIQIIVPI